MKSETRESNGLWFVIEQRRHLFFGWKDRRIVSFGLPRQKTAVDLRNRLNQKGGRWHRFCYRFIATQNPGDLFWWHVGMDPKRVKANIRRFLKDAHEKRGIEP